MKVKIADLSKTLKKYSNTWVALDEKDVVVAKGKEPSQVLERARAAGVDHPILTRAPKDYGAYIL